ncbi:MAG TPA: symmetrical bis(5'-nucleosyl)-tetraphosphatase [Kofleriaceae bacterium]|nr:symmetrical bis(5'-nucleosyl)-tetraphosphatase [Kofleriaceae bacterium]
MLYAIGDVQGCWRSLRALLDAIDHRPGLDRVWLCGDLVNRGPDSLEVLRWAMGQGDGVVSVLGNHDLHLLARAAGVRRARPRDTLDDVLTAPDRAALIEWLRARPMVHREAGDLLVHAGLLPAWSADDAERLAREVEATLRGPRWTELLGDWKRAPAAWKDDLGAGERRALAVSAFSTLRCVKQDGAMDRDYNGGPGEAPAGLLPWFDHPSRRSRDTRVVCGHWAALGLLLRPDLAALDTGCVWGDVLTALRIDDNALFQVPAKV